MAQSNDVLLEGTPNVVIHDDAAIYGGITTFDPEVEEPFMGDLHRFEETNMVPVLNAPLHYPPDGFSELPQLHAGGGA